MSREAAENLYSAIEKTTGLLDVPCSRDKVWPVLSAFQAAIPKAAILFRLATDARHAGEVNCHMMMLPGDVDPYALALSKGLLEGTDHPVGDLLADIEKRLPVESYGIDFGVVGGFQKAWSCFPGDSMQKLSDLAEIPSMATGLAANMDLFARHGLAENVTLIGMDYEHKTMNVYFGEADECLKPEAVKSMLRDMEMPEPSEQMLNFARQAFGFYATLSWDSPKIQRFCYSAITREPLSLLERVDPKIEHFLTEIPYGVDEPKVVYLATSPKEGEYCKVNAYYQWRPRLVKHMHASVSESAD
ncbi:aromatic prenyltransferase Orf2 [Actinomadura hallensis]|uniref:Aromatic prenyltransferase Orf2 n=1 Tax=Actinomadura hallensis TaxID=337895 RepID=A0A543IMS0_9ACTN|nr:aromatic prenyltransferase [Actinomadura hallensis]TQM71880.1 aromatic prenyltransferase Orf2 [Actinomadura hallensis]